MYSMSRITYEGKIETDMKSMDLMLVFPDELIFELGWKVDDELEIDTDELGNITIKNLDRE